MHNKVLIIANKTVVAGSYNFSENAEANDENMLVIESPQVATAYTNYFDALFRQYEQHGAPLPPDTNLSGKPMVAGSASALGKQARRPVLLEAAQ
jgi:phosphatidylserine/phosphatidylglycerophosphate/cardiolipin synthase-like enzyme